MKRLLMAMVGLGCVTAWTVKAQDADGRKGLTEEQSKQRQTLVATYDADGDGVLSKNEQKGLSKADKKTLAKTGGVGTARKAPKHDGDQHGKKRERSHDWKRQKQNNHKDHNALKSDRGGKGGSGGKGKGGKK